MTSAELQEYAEQIEEARAERRLQRRARRHAFWARLRDLVLSIPPGIGVRIGG
ncbi:hypothetical protein ABZ477_13830 [Microbacterium sp. NPDC019599]|uniref:hypothetical protein n=1 Tax=Microbacterium sp. NPDC019599 TaxID=3154690 RepID=UPI0033D666F7